MSSNDIKPFELTTNTDNNEPTQLQSPQCNLLYIVPVHVGLQGLIGQLGHTTDSERETEQHVKLNIDARRGTVGRVSVILFAR